MLSCVWSTYCLDWGGVLLSRTFATSRPLLSSDSVCERCPVFSVRPVSEFGEILRLFLSYPASLSAFYSIGIVMLLSHHVVVTPTCAWIYERPRISLSMLWYYNLICSGRRHKISHVIVWIYKHQWTCRKVASVIFNRSDGVLWNLCHTCDTTVVLSVGLLHRSSLAIPS